MIIFFPISNLKIIKFFPVKDRLMDKFKSVPERVILLAMDSVDYDEERASHILDIMVAEEAIRPLNTSSSQRLGIQFKMKRKIF